MANDNLLLVCGESSTGKSASLQNIRIHEGVMYLNTEAGKKLPFRNKFKRGTVIDPLQVPASMVAAEKMPDIHTIVVDSVTFMLDQYEALYQRVLTNT